MNIEDLKIGEPYWLPVVVTSVDNPAHGWTVRAAFPNGSDWLHQDDVKALVSTLPAPTRTVWDWHDTEDKVLDAGEHVRWHDAKLQCLNNAGEWEDFPFCNHELLNSPATLVTGEVYEFDGQVSAGDICDGYNRITFDSPGLDMSKFPMSQKVHVRVEVNE